MALGADKVNIEELRTAIAAYDVAVRMPHKSRAEVAARKTARAAAAEALTENLAQQFSYATYVLESAPLDAEEVATLVAATKFFAWGT